MKICPNCGVENSDQNQFCVKCNSIFYNCGNYQYKNYLNENYQLITTIGVFGALFFYLSGLLSKYSDAQVTNAEATMSSLYNISLGVSYADQCQFLKISTFFAFIIFLTISSLVIYGGYIYIKKGLDEYSEGQIEIYHHIFSYLPIVIITLGLAYFILYFLIFAIPLYFDIILQFAILFEILLTLIIFYLIKNRLERTHFSSWTQVVSLIVLTTVIALIMFLIYLQFREAIHYHFVILSLFFSALIGVILSGAYFYLKGGIKLIFAAFSLLKNCGKWLLSIIHLRTNR